MRLWHPCSASPTLASAAYMAAKLACACLMMHPFLWGSYVPLC